MQQGVWKTRITGAEECERADTRFPVGDPDSQHDHIMEN